jgi:uncharacterized coiled-coil DUF342 family protein
MSGNPYEASMRGVKLLRKDIEGISAKVTEIKDELKAISQRVTEIKDQLTGIEGKLPEKAKA